MLFKYRNLVHSTTGQTPAELFLGRTPRTKLSLVKPDLRGRVEGKQEKSKELHDKQAKIRTFDRYQPVKVRDMRGTTEKWRSGVIVEITGPVTYIVRLSGNVRKLVHADQMIPDDSREVDPEDEVTWNPELEMEDTRLSSQSNETTVSRPEVLVRNHGTPPPTPLVDPNPVVAPSVPREILVPSPQSLGLRRSSRHTKPRVKLDL